MGGRPIVPKSQSGAANFPQPPSGVTQFVSFTTPGHTFVGWSTAGQQNQSGSGGTAAQLTLPSSSSSKQSASITAKLQDVSQMDTEYNSDRKVDWQGSVTWRLTGTWRKVTDGEACLDAAGLHNFAPPREQYSVHFEVTLLINQSEGRSGGNVSGGTFTDTPLFPAHPETGIKAWAPVFTSIPFGKLVSPSNGFVIKDHIIVHCDFSVSPC